MYAYWEGVRSKYFLHATRCTLIRGCTLIRDLIVDVYFRGVWGLGMVATSPWVLALAPASGLIRQRSGHHYEVRLGLGIIFIIICLYYRRFGLRDGGYLPLGVGAGAGVRVDQTEVGTPL